MAAVGLLGGWPRSRRAGDRTSARLVCVPYAGGGASVFRAWSELLPPDVEVVPVQLPGRENRLGEAPYEELSELVVALAAALEIYDDGIPLALFGHSMGALVSYEVARLLRRRGGLRPMCLFVSGHRAPHQARRGRKIYELPNAELVDELSQFGGIPGAVLAQPEFLELLLPVLRADLRVSGTYTYVDETPLDCPIVAFAGVSDPLMTADEVQAWRRHTSGEFSVHMLPGDHFFLNTARAELVGLLWSDLSVQLRAVRAAPC